MGGSRGLLLDEVGSRRALSLGFYDIVFLFL